MERFEYEHVVKIELSCSEIIASHMMDVWHALILGVGMNQGESGLV